MYVRKCTLCAYFLLDRQSERLGRRLVAKKSLSQSQEKNIKKLKIELYLQVLPE